MDTWVKFCGITRAEDAQAAAALGAAAVGFVLVTESPRFISVDRAAIIRRRLPGSVKSVALFRNAPAEMVRRALDTLAPDYLQFHGEETAAYCESFGMAYLRAVPMRPVPDVAAIAREHPGAMALLLDGHGRGEAGGQGRSFDWSAVPVVEGRRVVLAGGLTPENVGRAIRQLRPFGVDVSSGIEAEPGIKDHGRMQRFIEEVRRAEVR